MEEGKHRNGGRKGYTPEDYRNAVQEAKSLSGAARLLDVTHSTVRGMCVRHDIYVPSIGGVPKPSDPDS